MARATGFVEVLADGSNYIDDRLHRFADMIESAVAHKYETERQKDQQDLIALRQKVSRQANRIIELYVKIGNAQDCLNLGEDDNDDN
jgi:hypothetical protein